MPGNPAFKYGELMTVAWLPRIEIFNKAELIGHVELPHKRTDVLPRVGEFVGFSESEICEALRLEYRITYTPQVTAVHHSIGPSGADVAVHIRMNTLRSLDQIDELARKNGIRWLPNRRVDA